MSEKQKQIAAPATSQPLTGEHQQHFKITNPSHREVQCSSFFLSRCSVSALWHRHRLLFVSFCFMSVFFSSFRSVFSPATNLVCCALCHQGRRCSGTLGLHALNDAASTQTRAQPFFTLCNIISLVLETLLNSK